MNRSLNFTILYIENPTKFMVKLSAGIARNNNNNSYLKSDYSLVKTNITFHNNEQLTN